MKHYYPTINTKHHSPAQQPATLYPISILNIATQILPKVHRELNAHYCWLQHDVATTLPLDIETYRCNRPEYTIWSQPDLTKGYLRLIHEHLESFH